MKPDYSPIWKWMIEREAIRVRRLDGMKSPWTRDSILATYRFCNVRREDDTVTRWIKKHIRKPYARHDLLWLMLCIARQINWPPTLQYLIDQRAWPDNRGGFRPYDVGHALNAWQMKGNKVYTGAYMIAAPPGKGNDKQMYIANTVIGDQWRRRYTFAEYFSDNPTLRGTHALLRQIKGWGPFMAYQAVVDMRFTDLLGRAKDLRTWAAAGPGTLRGLNRVHGRGVDNRLSQEQALDEMLEIYELSLKRTGIKIDFSDVPNVLCETDKYLRVKNKEGKPRALYVEGRGS